MGTGHFRACSMPGWQLCNCQRAHAVASGTQPCPSGSRAHGPAIDRFDGRGRSWEKRRLRRTCAVPERRTKVERETELFEQSPRITCCDSESLSTRVRREDRSAGAYIANASSATSRLASSGTPDELSAESKMSWCSKEIETKTKSNRTLTGNKRADGCEP